MTNVFKNFVSATIAKLASDGGLWLGERVRAAFQAFTMEHYEKDVTVIMSID